MTLLRLPGALAAAALLCLSACAAPVHAQVVISQMYGGGGNSGALYTNDFIEVFNRGNAPVNLDGWSVQYASGTGTSWQVTPLGNLTIQPGQYLLVQQAAGAGGSQALPTPDVTGTIAMGGTSGKVLLANVITAQSGACPTGPAVLDVVSSGASSSQCEGTPATGMANTTSIVRANGGCTDTNVNSADFGTANPPTPRNSAAPTNLCGGGGNLVLSIGNASQNEGDSGTTPMDFSVTLSGPAPAGGVAFTATTANGTAEAPSDYTALAAAPFNVPEGQTSATVSVQIVGDTVPEPNETFTVTIATATNGVVLGSATGTGTIINDDLLVLEIFEIQGNGLRSPYAPASGNALGQLVRTDANVVTALTGNGFYIQTPDARADADAMTSNGIFVFTGTTPTVAVGDLVDVVATVQEFFDWTQLTGPTVTVVGTGTLPTAVVLDETRPSPNLMTLSCGLTNFECFENMRVTVPAGAVVQGNQRFAADLFAEAFVTASGERARREKGLLPSVVPPAPGLPVWDGNPEVFELDADGAGAVPAGTAIYGGELFEATGVIAYQFGNYALRAASLTRIQVDLPRAVPATGGDAELRIASQNVLNFCTGGTCDPVKLARLADQLGNVLQLPDVIGLQELGTATAGQVLATRLNTDFGTDYVAYSGSSPFADGIRNGFLVRASRVAVVRTRELDAAVTIDQCSGTPPCVLHDRPPHLLEATFTGGDGERFAVLNNHTRSLIGITDAAPGGPRVRFKRFEQGKSIAGLVQRFQLGQELEPATPVGGIDTQDVPLVLVGDYNAFEVTDGYVDVVGLIKGTYVDSENEYQLAGPNLVDPPLLNLVDDVPEQERYSYTFRETLGTLIGENPRQLGSIQVLDHGLVNQAALDWCGSLVYGRGNADAPTELRNTGTGAVGSSDHDGFVVRLFTDRIGAYDFELPGRCVR